ncbi:hypothetical protein E2C01_078468 [Portunus trituberculatus]|uniref:Uncharacterized protein n=1 Tax=Portunus trituberculatus TaxID=210409 RepID=A0A5B7IIV1_PORTR|nr:hypothetical protein [Portunus trituberculatus]
MYKNIAERNPLVTPPKGLTLLREVPHQGVPHVDSGLPPLPSSSSRLVHPSAPVSRSPSFRLTTHHYLSGGIRAAAMPSFSSCKTLRTLSRIHPRLVSPRSKLLDFNKRVQ